MPTNSPCASHHRPVAVRPFPNGNGRHGRIAADYLVMALCRPRLGRGIGLDIDTEDRRATYRQALQHADTGRITRITAFARSWVVGAGRTRRRYPGAISMLATLHCRWAS